MTLMTNLITQQASLSTGIGYDVGRKRAGKPNQDSFGSYPDVSPSDDRLAQKGRLYIVADGMGGAAGGEVASQLAVELTLSTYYEDDEPDIEASLERAIQKANAQIHERSQTDVDCYGMGTTIVAAVFYGETVHIAHVGDSRAYLLRDGQYKQVTEDHSLVQQQVKAGILTPEEADAHPRRNILSRNLGSYAEARPDFTRLKLQQGDKLLMCSDGLSEEVSDDEMAGILQKYKPSIAVQALVELANEHGGSDNICVMVKQVDSLPQSTPASLNGTSHATEKPHTATKTESHARVKSKRAAHKPMKLTTSTSSGGSQSRGAASFPIDNTTLILLFALTLLFSFFLFSALQVIAF